MTASISRIATTIATTRSMPFSLRSATSHVSVRLLNKHKFSSSTKQAKEDGKRLYRFTNAGDNLSPPWKEFRNSVEKSLNAIWVSHRPRRKLSGALHKETNYGKTSDGLLVVRKPVDNSAKRRSRVSGTPQSPKIVREHIAHTAETPRALRPSLLTIPCLCLQARPFTKSAPPFPTPI